MSGIDIYFVIDESGSVGSSNYQLMKQFVHDTVNEFDIGSDDTQVGVISYSSYARAWFYLNTYQDKSSVLTAINNLPYSGGGTDTAAAINLLRQSGFTSTSGGLEHVDDELEGQVAVISLGQRRGGGASSTTPPGRA